MEYVGEVENSLIDPRQGNATWMCLEIGLATANERSKVRGIEKAAILRFVFAISKSWVVPDAEYLLITSSNEFL